MEGNAFDISLANLPDEKKADVVKYWLKRGASSVGFYPDTVSLHVDFKADAKGEAVKGAWGPNRSRSSLPQTPEWFQTLAYAHLADKDIPDPVLEQGGRESKALTLLLKKLGVPEGKEVEFIKRQKAVLLRRIQMTTPAP
jgi:hypothetical protein